MSDTQLKIYTPDDDFLQMRAQDLIISRLKLQQALSPAVTKGVMRAGQIAIDDVDVAADLRKSIPIIPLMFWFQWIEFNPNMDAAKGQRVLAKSVDPSSDLAYQAESYIQIINSQGKKVNKVTESYNFIVLAPTIGAYDRMFAISFQRSSHRIGKSWLNRLRNMRGEGGVKLNMWRNMWELSAEFLDEGADKKYFIPALSNPILVPDDKFDLLAGLSTKLREQRVRIAEREMEREVAESDQSAPANTKVQNEPAF